MLIRILHQILIDQFAISCIRFLVFYDIECDFFSFPFYCYVPVNEAFPLENFVDFVMVRLGVGYFLTPKKSSDFSAQLVFHYNQDL